MNAETTQADSPTLPPSVPPIYLVLRAGFYSGGAVAFQGGGSDKTKVCHEAEGNGVSISSPEVKETKDSVIWHT